MFGISPDWQWPIGLITAGIVVIAMDAVFIYNAFVHAPEVTHSYEVEPR